MAIALEHQRYFWRKVSREMIERYCILDGLGYSIGPLEIAGFLMGYENLFVGLHMFPDSIHALLRITTTTVLRWLEAQQVINGPLKRLYIADHIPSQIRIEHLEEFALPYLREIYETYPNAIRLYHNEGHHSDEHIRSILTLPFETWHFGSGTHRIEELLPKITRPVTLFGGLDPLGVIQHSTPEETAAETRRCLIMAANYGIPLLISSGTGLTPTAPLENVRAMVVEAERFAIEESKKQQKIAQTLSGENLTQM
jgi:uroporphyrinogen decarboxylase